jgi:hypothetical protein
MAVVGQVCSNNASTPQQDRDQGVFLYPFQFPNVYAGIVWSTIQTEIATIKKKELIHVDSCCHKIYIASKFKQMPASGWKKTST